MEDRHSGCLVSCSVFAQPGHERLSSLLLAVPPSIEKEDVEDAVKVPEGETAHLMCNVSGKGHTVDWRRVKRQLSGGGVLRGLGCLPTAQLFPAGHPLPSWTFHSLCLCHKHSSLLI